MEYETDTTLVYLVRIQYLIDRIAQCSSPENNLDDMPVVPALPAPRDVYVSSLQAELDQIRHDLPPRLKLDSRSLATPKSAIGLLTLVEIFQTYINTAALRLHAPPCIDSELITSLAEALTSSFDRPSSTLDEIYRSHSVLVAWFDNWLSVPVSSYYCQTTATCTLLVYAISMLGRWAKLITPSKLHKDRAGIPEDCLTGDGNCITTPASTETPSVSSTATSAPTPAASDSSQDKEPCGYNHHNPQVRSDPGLPVAVASLQLPLRQQPGLDIDIPAILSTCQARFQQVSSSIQKSSSSEAESGDHNVWSMSAIKILITRAKLERWADLVAAGTEALSLEDCATQDAIMGDVGGNPLQDGFLDGFGEINPGMGMPDFGDGMGPVWMMDLMPATEPTAFFDGYIDWSTVVMNSMGSVDQ